MELINLVKTTNRDVGILSSVQKQESSSLQGEVVQWNKNYLDIEKNINKEICLENFREFIYNKIN